MSAPLDTKRCLGPECDYEAMLTGGPLDHALATALRTAIYFRDDTESPQGDHYKTLLEERFTPSERLRLRACANCILTSCLNRHTYKEPTPTQKFGTVI